MPADMRQHVRRRKDTKAAYWSAMLSPPAPNLFHRQRIERRQQVGVQHDRQTHGMVDPGRAVTRPADRIAARRQRAYCPRHVCCRQPGVDIVTVARKKLARRRCA